jgi:hypothetical protein
MLVITSSNSNSSDEVYVLKALINLLSPRIYCDHNIVLMRVNIIMMIMILKSDLGRQWSHILCV